MIGGMALMLNEYTDFQAFKYKGRRFLALVRKGDGNVHVFGDGLANYGSYMDVKSFKKFYGRDGEDLRLS